MAHTPEQKREHSRTWRRENKAEHNRKQREWNTTIPGKRKNFQTLVRKHGLTVEEYAWRLYCQDFQCAIRGCDYSAISGLRIDHCHKNGHVRGILCPYHNCVMGGIDSPDFDAMVEYKKLSTPEHEWPKGE